ncbi:MAG: cytochrome c biogenesis CcdA family protein [Thermovenabulum sp.]|uniref:cytochrome c biogenesis CcdA family protein n=1 Tax=Thermovenabulum sp. TaxID=3100335 RepID=UPI003C7B7117
MNYGVTFFSAFMGGILAFFSPCIVPLLPVYIGILAGSGADKKANTVLNSLFFIIGFSLMFTLLGLSFTAISKFFIINKIIFSRIAGIIVILLGLNLLDFLRINFLLKEKRKYINFKTISPLTSFLLGVFFSAGWTPCIGPILSAILILAGSTRDIKTGSLLLITFSLGLGLPFFIFSILFNASKKIQGVFSKLAPYSKKLAGILLIIMGMLLFFNLI